MTTDGLVPGAPGGFLSPREVVLGAGELRRLGKLLNRCGVHAGPVFVVCDRVVSGLGHTAAVTAHLEADGFTAVVFDGITGEPDAATADAVVRDIRSRDAVAVVGIGGGSALDVAKLAAALATGSGGVLDYVGADRLTQPRLPLVLVPTTAGTGAEATRIAMISHEGEKVIVNDPHLVPDGVILDPALVGTLPPPVTASTGLDALSHGIESMLSLGATALSAHMSENAIRLLSSALPDAYRDGTDREARRSTLYGAYLAGLGLNAGVVLGHSIAYTIANRRRLPHGLSAGMALPYCVAYVAPVATERLARISAAAGLTGPDVDQLVRWLGDLNATFDVPGSLRALDLSPSDATEMAAECVEKYPRPTNMAPLDLDVLEHLYRYLYEGDLGGSLAHMQELVPPLVAAQEQTQ